MAKKKKEKESKKVVETPQVQIALRQPPETHQERVDKIIKWVVACMVKAAEQVPHSDVFSLPVIQDYLSDRQSGIPVSLVPHEVYEILMSGGESDSPGWESCLSMAVYQLSCLPVSPSDFRVGEARWGAVRQFVEDFRHLGMLSHTANAAMEIVEHLGVGVSGGKANPGGGWENVSDPTDMYDFMAHCEELYRVIVENVDESFAEDGNREGDPTPISGEKEEE